MMIETWPQMTHLLSSLILFTLNQSRLSSWQMVATISSESRSVRLLSKTLESIIQLSSSPLLSSSIRNGVTRSRSESTSIAAFEALLLDCSTPPGRWWHHVFDPSSFASLTTLSREEALTLHS